MKKEIDGIDDIIDNATLLLSQWEREFDLSVINPVINLKYGFDIEGFLLDPSEWSPLVCIVIAKEEFKLTKEHWQVISILRGYYKIYQIPPAARVLVIIMGKHFGEEKGSSKYLHSLYPYGNRQAAKYAGFLQPRGLI